jgi:hypothetical protein
MLPTFAKLLAFSSVFCLTACIQHLEPSGPTKRESRNVARGKAEMVRVELNMGAGKLRAGSGTGQLFDGEFIYNSSFCKPEVRYDESSFRGHLEIRSPSTTSHMGNNHCDWDLRFSEEVPLDFDVHFGAGEARLDLGRLDLRSLTVNMGVGQLTVDLRGQPKHDYDVQVHGGVGEAIVHLPSDVAVIATAHGGIGGIDVRGLHKDGDRWVNETSRHGNSTIRVNVTGGVGHIQLIAD